MEDRTPLFEKSSPLSLAELELLRDRIRQSFERVHGELEMVEALILAAQRHEAGRRSAIVDRTAQPRPKP